MKFPSVIKTPKHNRFKYEPRHYDPIKEDIEGKLRRAGRRENSSLGVHQARISEAFRQRQSRAAQSSVLQVLIAIVLMVTLAGWWFYGNNFLYICLLLFPLYVFWRLRAVGRQHRNRRTS